ncbi:hypothetical protein BDQ12DRAFT_719125 [Crucibulum laeve]|uniref:Uncharacterized protein n=1 Tax=Crucibulum laeve TaxID=68775 RepID=A0A5C3MF20_9AGAR|nr:hypothetical protein BDQ12DRAFT_719125 [Crucibulum laeve]
MLYKRYNNEDNRARISRGYNEFFIERGEGIVHVMTLKANACVRGNVTPGVPLIVESFSTRLALDSAQSFLALHIMVFGFFTRKAQTPVQTPPESLSAPAESSGTDSTRQQLRTPSPSIASETIGKQRSPSQLQDAASPFAIPPITPSPPPSSELVIDPVPLHVLISSVPPQTLHAYALSHLIPPSHAHPLSPLISPASPPISPPSPRTLTVLTSFFAALAPPPKLHCVRCHKGYFELENSDRSCVVAHDDESAEVERVGIANSKGGTEYETLWGCCGQTVEGDGDMGPPDGWCYEGKHTTDPKRARFRADSTLQDDKLTTCARMRCHDPPPARSSRGRKRGRVEFDVESQGSSIEEGSTSKKARRGRKKAQPEEEEESSDNENEMDIDDPLPSSPPTPKSPKAKPKPKLRSKPTTTKAKSPLSASFVADSQPPFQPSASPTPSGKVPIVEVASRSSSPARKTSVLPIKEGLKSRTSLTGIKGNGLPAWPPKPASSASILEKAAASTSNTITNENSTTITTTTTTTAAASSSSTTPSALKVRNVGAAKTVVKPKSKSHKAKTGSTSTVASAPDDDVPTSISAPKKPRPRAKYKSRAIIEDSSDIEMAADEPSGSGSIVAVKPDSIVKPTPSKPASSSAKQASTVKPKSSSSSLRATASDAKPAVVSDSDTSPGRPKRTIVRPKRLSEMVESSIDGERN